MLLCPGSHRTYRLWTGKVSDEWNDQVTHLHVSNVLIVFFCRQKAAIFPGRGTRSLLIVGGHQVRVGDVCKSASEASRTAAAGVVIDFRSVFKEDAVDLFNTRQVFSFQCKPVVFQKEILNGLKVFFK